jgi:hypothetical protein
MEAISIVVHSRSLNDGARAITTVVIWNRIDEVKLFMGFEILGGTIVPDSTLTNASSYECAKFPFEVARIFLRVDNEDE